MNWNARYAAETKNGPDISGQWGALGRLEPDSVGGWGPKFRTKSRECGRCGIGLRGRDQEVPEHSTWGNLCTDCHDVENTEL